MSDYFVRLETELRAAAQRPTPRTPDWGTALSRGAIAAATATVVALSAVVALVFLGGGGADEPDRTPATVEPLPVGTVIPQGQGTPPRESDSTVVAGGRTRVAGPWQLELARGTGVKDPKTGEVYEPAGLTCLTIYLLRPPKEPTATAAGQCGGFPRTPGFGRLQLSVPASSSAPGYEPREVLVYGRVPERAAAVALTSRRGVRRRARIHEGPPGVKGDFYLVALTPRFGPGRINWRDKNGRPGSRGIALMVDTKGRL